MDTTPATKDDMLRLIDTGRASWESLLADVGEERLELSGATGDWTFRDVVAHLNAWRELTLVRLGAAARGEESVSPPWPAGLDDDSPEGTDAINAWFYQRARDRAAADVIAESSEQLQQMHAIVTTLSPEDLFTPGRFSWLGDYPLSAVVEGSFEHLAEHEEEIREWLNNTESSNRQ